METADLTGAALDWAVAQCLDARFAEFVKSGWPYSPSTDWGQGGPIIERERMDVWVGCDTDNWCATKANNEDAAEDFVLMQGQTPLIAAMRCYVASKLGTSVEIPEELK